MEKALKEKMLYAAETGDSLTIRKLVKNFADINVKDHLGVSALTKAVGGIILKLSTGGLSQGDV